MVKEEDNGRKEREMKNERGSRKNGKERGGEKEGEGIQRKGKIKK